MGEFIYKLEKISNVSYRYVVYDNDMEIGALEISKATEPVLIISRVYVSEEYRGNKIANKLVKLTVEFAKENNYKIVPLCEFARREFDRTPEYTEIEK